MNIFVLILLPLGAVGLLVGLLSMLARPPLNQALMDRLQRGRGDPPLYPDDTVPGSGELVGSWQGTEFRVRCPHGDEGTTDLTVTVALSPWPRARALPPSAFEKVPAATDWMTHKARRLLVERMWADLSVQVDDGVLSAHYSISDESPATVWRLLRWTVIQAQILEVSSQDTPDWLEERCVDRDAPREVRWVAGWQLMTVAPERAPVLLTTDLAELQLAGLEAMEAPPLEQALALTLDGWQPVPLRLGALELLHRHDALAVDGEWRERTADTLGQLVRGTSHTLFVRALELLAEAGLVPELKLLGRRFGELPPSARVAIARASVAHGEAGAAWAQKRLEDEEQPEAVQLALVEAVIEAHGSRALPTLMRLLPGRPAAFRTRVLHFREELGQSSDGGLALVDEGTHTEGGLSIEADSGGLAVSS